VYNNEELCHYALYAEVQCVKYRRACSLCICSLGKQYWYQALLTLWISNFWNHKVFLPDYPEGCL